MHGARKMRLCPFFKSVTAASYCEAHDRMMESINRPLPFGLGVHISLGAYILVGNNRSKV
jgi:hypothetical protein